MAPPTKTRDFVNFSPLDPPQATIIGVYGLPGSGKSFLLKEIKTRANLSGLKYVFYDGSELIDRVVEGGLNEFKRMSDAHQAVVREKAMAKVYDECKDNKTIAIISGHLMFWEMETALMAKNVGTKKDWETYTHMIYLHVDAQVVAERRTYDVSRLRPHVSIKHLKKWQDEEMKELRRICYEHGILFTSVSAPVPSTGLSLLEPVMKLLEEFQRGSKEVNALAVEKAVDMAVEDKSGLETMLVLDADKTLAPSDTGAMFWDLLASYNGFANDPLSTLFKTQGHSHASFRQAKFLYEEVASIFDSTCDSVVGLVDLYPEMKALLQRVASEPHVGAVVVTCGLQKIWQKVLENHGLSHIQVIGSGRPGHGFVVTGSTKGQIIDSLHQKKLRVLSFGDSPLDMEMLHKADEAYVVVGTKETRSSSMDEKLTHAIEKDGLSALQVVLSKDSTHRLNLNTLPTTNLDAAEMDFMFKRPSRFEHATDKKAAKLLMTPMRDTANAGPDLRQAHETVGYYLATEILSEIIGLEQVEISHVQGKPTDGYRFRHERAILIVPLMRGGEPMAFGVSKAMPHAGFAHAKKFSDVDVGNWKGKRTVILVDSVINTGKSIVEFVEPLREKYPHVRVVIVAGVVQADAVKKGNLAEMLLQDRNMSIVALRKSENRFTGRGTTDTGHRLFNTTYLH